MIIGISGTFCSGKDTLAKHFESRFGFLLVNSGDIVREIALEQSGSIERPVLYKTANELRHKYGSAILVEKALDRYHNSISNYPGVVITGIRSMGEAKAIKDLGGTLLFVDSEKEIRYKRMQARMRDNEVSISFEDFLKRESDEMHSGDSDADFNLKAISEIADFIILNNNNEQQFINNAENALLLS
jgi:dephospho-CoA kinase